MATLTKQQYKVVWCSDQWGWCVTTLVTAYPGEGLDGNPIRATIIVAICARKSDAEALAKQQPDSANRPLFEVVLDTRSV